MTVSNFPIDDQYVPVNMTKLSIINNEPLEQHLHVVMMISNPCLFKKRYQLAKDFIKRMNNEKNVELYIVEILYKNQKRFAVTQKGNKKHLQLRVDSPIWHKENALNLGVEKLLPSNWKAFAWIDADIEFESATWATDTLKLLNGTYDLVQIFSHAVDMDENKCAMQLFQGFGYQYTKGQKMVSSGLEYWHPGYAWAITKKAYEQMGGLYERNILGSGDHLMAMALIGDATRNIGTNYNNNFKKDLLDLQHRCKGLRIGYVPCVIRHFFHGSKENRRYKERNQILVEYQFDPLNHIERDKNGVLVPTAECPKGMLNDIAQYFQERNEDE